MVGSTPDTPADDAVNLSDLGEHVRALYGAEQLANPQTVWTLRATNAPGFVQGSSTQDNHGLQPVSDDPNAITVVSGDEDAPLDTAPQVLKTPGEFNEGETAEGNSPEDRRRTLAAALSGLGEQVRKDNLRSEKIDKAAVAKLFNGVRPRKLRRGDDAPAPEEGEVEGDIPLQTTPGEYTPGDVAGGTDRQPSQRKSTHQDHMDAITSAMEMEWFRAQGLNAGEVSALRWASFASGLINPFGTFAMNAVTYIAAPYAGLALGSSWYNVLIGIISTALSPLANSSQQPTFVELGGSIRAEKYNIVSGKGSLNDAEWPAEVGAELEQQARDFLEKGGQLEDAILQFQPPGEETEAGEAKALALAAIAAADGNELKRVLDAATPAVRALLEETVGDLLGSVEKSEDIHLRLLRTEGSHDRQEIGNTTQILPRSLRGPASTLVGLGRGSEPGEPLGRAGRVSVFSAADAVKYQAFASVFLNGVQMLTAGIDERRKQDYNNKLNLLYADCLTPDGERHEKAGDAFGEEDIDAEKVAALIQSPAQVVVKQMTAVVTKRRKALEAAVALLGDEEMGVVLTDEERQDQEILEDALRIMKEDEKKLKEFDLEGLSESLTMSLFNGTLDTFKTTTVWANLVKKYQTKGELPAQTGQRIGQVFHLGLFGSGGSAMIGRTVGAILGGASQEKTYEIGILAAVGFVFGAVGAWYQSGAIKIKNLRRGLRDTADKAEKKAEEDPSDENMAAAVQAKEHEISLKGQIKMGIGAAYHVASANSAANQANAEFDAAKQQIQTTYEVAIKLDTALRALKDEEAGKKDEDLIEPVIASSSKG
jgi:hypothetical protein